MTRKKALIVGALGVIGRNLVEHLTKLDDWEVVGLSRRTTDFTTRAHFISLDLLARDACQQKLKDLTDITHIFYAAFQDRPSMAEMIAPNLTILKNVVVF